MTRLIRWLIPGGLILATALVLAFGLGPENLLEKLGGSYPWVAFCIMVLLGASFHRSRVVLFLLGLCGLLLVYSRGVSDLTAFHLVGGLLAVSMGFLSLSQDRGVLSSGGLVQMMALLLVFFFGMLLLELAPGDFAALLAAVPLSPGVTEWSGLPQPVFLAFLFSLPTTLAAAVFREGPVERGIFWSLLLVAFALHFSSDAGAVNVCLTGAGLTLGLSVLETSYAMAYKDDLTGLPSRRALMRDLDGTGGTYSAAMVDVDHFKKFNDRYGHDVGDQVLRMVAARLAKAPGGGRAYRYGGEEFTLFFPGKPVQEALPHLKAARRSVEEAVFTLRSWRRPRKKPVDPGAWRVGGKRESGRLSVTVSIGVADATGNDASPEAVLKKADQALYRAKNAGRNRVAK
ncbi:MAG: GGDEF domain-containing protein [Gemmatimonadota bacterium]